MKKLTVVIVDDDEMILMMHERILRRCELVNDQPMLLCRNGSEAIQTIRENDSSGNSYLILLDLNMPVMDGWQFLSELERTKVQSETMICIVTSSLDLADKRKAEKSKNVITYIEKPLGMTQAEELKTHPVLSCIYSGNIPSA